MTKNQIKFRYREAITKYKRSVKIKGQLQERIKRLNTLQAKSIAIAHDIINNCSEPQELIEALKEVKIDVDLNMIQSGWENSQSNLVDFNSVEWEDVLFHYCKLLEQRIVDQSTKTVKKEA